MKISKPILLSIIFMPFLVSCGDVSYPKEDLDKSLQELVKKETGIDPSIIIVGKTIYLDIEIDGFLSDNLDDINEAFKKIQTASSDIIRIVLSSDSDIQFMVVNAYPPNKKSVIRIIQSLDDFKDFYYMRISKDDYESRTVFETQTLQKAELFIKDKRDLTLDEYVARMIVSSVISRFRANPFLAEMMSPMRLSFEEIKDKVLIISCMQNNIDAESKQFLEMSFLREGKKYLQKYDVSIEKIRLISANKKTLLSITL
jgi:hypothetical protein